MVFTLFCEEILTIDFKSMAWISWTWSIVFLDPNPLKEYCAQAYFSIITGPKEHALTILLSDFLFAMLFCFFFSFRGCLWTLCCIWIQDPFAFKHSQTGIHLYGRKLYIQGGFEKNLINLSAHYWVANLQLIRWRNLSCIVIECKNHVFKLDM
jgi:hypothetical protein